MLENDLSVDNMKETTASQAQRISPFKDSPLAIFKDILSDCCHICGSEFSHEHSSDSIDSHNRIICYLMVHSLVMIETYDCFYVVAVEGTSSRTAMAAMGLKVEPGALLVWVAELISGRDWSFKHSLKYSVSFILLLS